MVALLPLLPGVSVVAVPLVRICLKGVISVDELDLLFAISAGLGTAVSIFAWRTLVLWTLGRKVMTGVVALIPFAQVIYPYPLWSTSGCFSFADTFLRFGQHSIDAGLWVWLTIWIWWGWEKRAMTMDDTKARAVAGLSRTARRILASVGYVPLVLGVFMVVVLALERLFGPQTPNGQQLSMAYFATAWPALALWVMIWRRGPSRSAMPWSGILKSAGICIGLPILVVVVNQLLPEPIGELGAVPLMGWGVWMIWTAWTWPLPVEDVVLSATAPCCLRCGYLLNGLRWTRCPECGDEPTLDELWQATANVNA